VGLIKDGSGYRFEQQDPDHTEDQIHGEPADHLVRGINRFHEYFYCFRHLGPFPLLPEIKLSDFLPDLRRFIAYSHRWRHEKLRSALGRSTASQIFMHQYFSASLGNKSLNLNLKHCFTV
jgi:hypothetical protein